MKNKILTAFVLIMTLQGCATSYSTQGFTGGYSETRLDTNVFQVSFNGNGFTSFQKTRDFTLLRSAEITLENGYKYFTVVDASTDSSTSYINQPKTYQTTAQVNTYGNYAYGTATTRQTGGGVTAITKPSSRNTIVLYTEKPVGVLSYNASIVVSELKKQYDIE